MCGAWSSVGGRCHPCVGCCHCCCPWVVWLSVDGESLSVGVGSSSSMGGERGSLCATDGHWLLMWHAQRATSLGGGVIWLVPLSLLFFIAVVTDVVVVVVVVVVVIVVVVIIVVVIGLGSCVVVVVARAVTVV